jgi:hypothetical protein
LQGSGSSQKQGLLCFKTLRLQVATCKNERVGGVFKKPPPLSKAPATLAHSLSQSTLNTMPPLRFHAHAAIQAAEPGRAAKRHKMVPGMSTGGIKFSYLVFRN